MEPERETVYASTELDDNSSNVEPDCPSLQADSGIGLDDSSISSEGYIQLLGRRYRNWGFARENCERYFCIDDEGEIDRQDIQHYALTLLMENKLHLAPLPIISNIQVLDVCAGNGAWAIDIGSEHPHWSVSGVDWSPMQPNWVPPNVRFHLDDMRQLPWCHGSGCDYIHTRGTIHTGCWNDFKVEAVEQAFERLKPGGWFESQELGCLVECDDGTLPADSSLASWARLLDRAGALKNHPRHVAHKMVQWYKEVGFVDVQQRLLKMPIGCWPENHRMKEIGRFWQLCLELGLESLSLRLLNETFGWGLSEMTGLLGRVKQDIRNRSIHAYTQVYVVYGRKPWSGEPTSTDTRASNPPKAVEGPTERLSSWSPTPEPLRPRSSDFGCDPSDDADSSSSGLSSAPVSLADDASASSSLFRHQRQDLVNRLLGQLCRYLDSRVAEAQLARTVSSWHTNGGFQQRGEQSQSVTRQEQALRADESGEAGDSAAARSHGYRPPPGPGGEDDNNGDIDDRRRKRPRLSSSSSGETKRLACPYYKRNPRKYGKWTSCPGPGWDEIHRVKAHLYKRHALPLQCPRCWESFRAESWYREHLQQDPPCAVQAMQRNVLDGFTKEQEEMLRSRRKTRPDMSSADKWKEVYMILFPDDNVDDIPSSYYEATDNGAKNSGKEDCNVFLRREMPAAARRELDLMFQDGFRDMELALRPRIEQLMVDLQLRLLRSWTSLENDGRGDLGELDEPRDTEQEQEREREPADRDLVFSADLRADRPSGSQDTGYDTVATVIAEQGVPTPQPGPNATELDAVVQQQEGLWDWGHAPSVSGSADTLFLLDAFFDISFEKLLDPTFADSLEMQEGNTDLT
ncbi:S-adenosyl-L-methionine-dependent methyltransferase [Lasiosphaeria hispida]|uniref:S-adenosyl-L-methionine-dependent methyltransferase n=1 Tax=Lasiosphaeria hispida TaxID=260671 RepID=A0AAJ0HE89_9PEZI|nr:S-adenosyl-L-methionine-dependent methyltransferase [Lasiosphaeria hispida]